MTFVSHVYKIVNYVLLIMRVKRLNDSIKLLFMHSFVELLFDIIMLNDIIYMIRPRHSN